MIFEQFSTIKYILVQQIFGTFSSCKSETLHSLNTDSISLPLAIPFLLDMIWAIVDNSFEWNHILYFSRWLFLLLSIISLRFTPCYSMWHDFLLFKATQCFTVCIYIIYSFSIHLSMDIWIASTPRLLGIMLW